MANTLVGRKRIRKFFGKIKEVAEMPNLIEVQKASYDQFLMVDEPKGGRPDEGLQSVFKSVFPISDFSNTSLLEFVKYEFEQPKYDVDECRQRGMTFSAPLKVTLRLIVFDVDPDTGAKSVKVTIPYKTPHPLYHKVINRKTVVHAHDEKNETKVGDKVEIMETRPLSRLKRWRVVSVIQSAVGTTAEAITEADVAATGPTKTTRAGAAAAAPAAPQAPTA